MKNCLFGLKLFAYLFLFILTYPGPAMAADTGMPVLQIPIPNVEFKPIIKCTTPGDENKNCVNWIAEYIAGIYKYAIGIVGILATVVMMIGGVVWILSGGNASTAGEAKAYIAASLTGLIITLTSYMILNIVNPNLVSFKTLAIGKIIPDISVQDAVASFTSGGGEVGTSNVVNDLPAEYNRYLSEVARSRGLDCTMLKAIVYAESGGNPTAKSSVGALGLMQLMPTTAAQYGCYGSDLTNPQSNIQCGASYVKYLMSNACNGKASNEVCNVSKSYEYIIAAYNGGPKANSPSKDCPGKTWWQCEINKGYAQTRIYVPRVMANYTQLTAKGFNCQ